MKNKPTFLSYEKLTESYFLFKADQLLKDEAKIIRAGLTPNDGTSKEFKVFMKNLRNTNAKEIFKKEKTNLKDTGIIKKLIEHKPDLNEFIKTKIPKTKPPPPPQTKHYLPYKQNLIMKKR